MDEYKEKGERKCKVKRGRVKNGKLQVERIEWLVCWQRRRKWKLRKRRRRRRYREESQGVAVRISYFGERKRGTLKGKEMGEGLTKVHHHHHHH